MKVYIATRFDLWREAAAAADALAAAGHTCTARWIDVARELGGVCAAVPVGDPRRLDEARNDLDDVAAAHVLLLLVPAERGTGCWWEAGFAQALGTPIVAVGDCRARTIFGEFGSREGSGRDEAHTRWTRSAFGRHG